MKKAFIVAIIIALLSSCSDKPGAKKEDAPINKTESTTSSGGNPSYDPNRGIGKFSEVTIEPMLNQAMATSGEKSYGVKCASCHKLTEEKLVGPGWKGVTNKFSAPWILNFMTNTDEMLNKDPKAQAQLEICLVRMPNQNLSDEEARSLYEFMRKNDGVK